MGLIICKKHGESGIIQFSETLFRHYHQDKETNITLLEFKYPNIPEIHHYFDSSEDLSSFLIVDSFQEFESKFSEISGSSGACALCFKEYIDNHSIVITKKRIAIPLED